MALTGLVSLSLSFPALAVDLGQIVSAVKALTTPPMTNTQPALLPASAATALPPTRPAPSSQTANAAPAQTFQTSSSLGVADVTTTEIHYLHVDCSKGCAFSNTSFTVLTPKFPRKELQLLYDASTGLPADPTFYASKSFTNDKATNISHKAEIDALPPAEQAAVLGNLLLYLKWQPDPIRSIANLVHAFPQLKDIEYVWYAPDYDPNNGHVIELAQGSEPHPGSLRRGDLDQFLLSAVQSGVPKSDGIPGDRAYPLIAERMMRSDLRAIAKLAATEP